MDVDVDLAARNLQKQHQRRMAVAGHEVAIGAAHGAEQQLVPHRPAVDVEILLAAGRAVEGGQADEAGEMHAVALGIHRHRAVAEVAPEHGGEAGEADIQQLALAGGVFQRRLAALADGEAEGDLGVGHREALQHVFDVILLGARRLEEFQPGRHGVEEVAYLDPCSRRMRGRRHRPHRTALDGEAPGAVGAAPAAGQGQAADGAD